MQGAQPGQIGQAFAVDEISAHKVPYADFLKRYVHANKPVVVLDAIDHWPAMKKWTPAFFKHAFGDRVVPVGYDAKQPFGDFIDDMLASSPEKPGPYMYRLFVHEDLPEVLKDLAPQSAYGFPRRLASDLMPHGWRRPDGFLKLLIGGPGSSFPVMHFDANAVHATVTEIYGDKEFILFPPEDTPHVYPVKDAPNKSAVRNPTAPDLAAFPLMRKASLYRTVLRPGSMVFIPRGWWHTARPLSHSISIGMNIVDASNYRQFVFETFAGDFKDQSLPRKLISAVKILQYLAIGQLMDVMEGLQRLFPGLARALAFPGRIAPSDVSWLKQDPSEVTIDARSRHVG